MTYSEAIQFLYDLQMFGAKFGLENTRKLAALAGNPQDKLRFIHVAGTNGKGSTCAMLESIYRAAGLRTGLFISPHLISFAERMQINRQWIPEAEVTRLVGETKILLKEFSHDAHPTFFEVVTIMALKYFAEQKCDLVIWETGMGGRLDATNIVTPLASVITNVQLDHQKWLGDTLEKIAFEKAGIIKPNVFVITGADSPEALRVISDVARENTAPLTILNPYDAFHLTQDHVIPLPGEHQKMNAAVALTTARLLKMKIPLSETEIRSSLANVEWPGRFQLFKVRPGQTIVVDGAHNVAGAETLVATLKKYFPSVKPVFILGILQDKDWEQICEILAPMAEKIFLVPVQSQRSTQPQQLLEKCASEECEAVFACDSVFNALEKTKNERLVVVTGSLYLVGEALEILQKPGANQISERKLNEWTDAPSAAGSCTI